MLLQTQAVKRAPKLQEKKNSSRVVLPSSIDMC